MNMLPVIRIEGKDYFVDKRLSQIRNIINPHDFEDVSPELIDYWLSTNYKNRHNLTKR